GAILRADIIALPHPLGGIVALPKCLQQFLVRDFLRIVDHQHNRVMPGAPAADLFISRVRGLTRGITNRGDMDSIAQLPELALGTPEASEAKDRCLQPLRIWAF